MDEEGFGFDGYVAGMSDFYGYERRLSVLCDDGQGSGTSAIARVRATANAVVSDGIHWLLKTCHGLLKSTCPGKDDGGDGA